jgi:hypothetical protein
LGLITGKFVLKSSRNKKIQSIFYIAEVMKYCLQRIIAVIFLRNPYSHNIIFVDILAGPCKHNNKPSGSTKGGEFFD